MTNKHIIEEYLLGKADIDCIPIHGTFEISPICNMDCKMCYIKKSKKEVNNAGGLKSADEWLELAREARKAGLLFLQLTGGEVLLYKDFKYLYTELSKMGFIITINTNATLIDEENIKIFSEYPPRCIYITLYGGSNETYETLCNNPRGFDQVKKGIDMLLENNITLKINSCITPYNIHDMYKIHKFIKDRNLAYDFTPYSFPPMRKDKEMIGTNDRFTPEECAEYLIEIKKIDKTNDEFNQEVETFISCLTNNEKVNEEHKMQCRAGHSSFWITWDGKMTPCGMMCSPNMDVFEIGFNKCWDFINNKTKEIILCSECNECDYRSICDVCGAMILTETGKYDKKPNYICNKTKKIANKLKKYHEQIGGSSDEV